MTSLVTATRREDSEAPGMGREAVRLAEARRDEPVERAAPRAPITLVVGMHRSGTSFLARQLVSGGLVVPGTPMAGHTLSNPDGHFEPWEVRPLEEQALTLRRLLLDLDGRDTPETHRGWVVKDPRLCRALPSGGGRSR